MRFKASFVTFVTINFSIMEKDKTAFGALRLKNGTLDRMRHLKIAFEGTYKKEMTNDEFIGHLIASVEDGDIAVWERFCELEV